MSPMSLSLTIQSFPRTKGVRIHLSRWSLASDFSVAVVMGPIRPWCGDRPSGSFADNIRHERGWFGHRMVTEINWLRGDVNGGSSIERMELGREREDSIEQKR